MPKLLEQERELLERMLTKAHQQSEAALNAFNTALYKRGPRWRTSVKRWADERDTIKSILTKLTQE
jgi:hypothetical protein